MSTLFPTALAVLALAYSVCEFSVSGDSLQNRSRGWNTLVWWFSSLGPAAIASSAILSLQGTTPPVFLLAIGSVFGVSFTLVDELLHWKATAGRLFGVRTLLATWTLVYVAWTL